MSDEEYNKLFDGLIKHYSKKMSCINNPTALGFVDYTMIPTKSAIKAAHKTNLVFFT